MFVCVPSALVGRSSNRSSVPRKTSLAASLCERATEFLSAVFLPAESMPVRNFYLSGVYSVELLSAGHVAGYVGSSNLL